MVEVNLRQCPSRSAVVEEWIGGGGGHVSIMIGGRGHHFVGILTAIATTHLRGFDVPRIGTAPKGQLTLRPVYTFVHLLRLEVGIAGGTLGMLLAGMLRGGVGHAGFQFQSG